MEEEKHSSNFAINEEVKKKAQRNSHTPEAEAKRKASLAIYAATGISKKALKQQAYEAIRNKLLETKKASGETYLNKYIDKFLNTALSDMESNPSKLLSNMIFKTDLIDNIDMDARRAQDDDIDYKKYLIRTTLYDKQQQVYDDETSKGMIIINSRRSGKTELLGRLIGKGLLKPDAHVVYINRTSSAAIRQIRGPLETALNKINLKCIKGSVDAQEMHFENGSQLLILGNNNSADIDKLRGERISLCLCDEIGHQRNIRTLIRETISPALRDYADSQLVMVGTPPRLPHTYIEELWNNPDVSYKKYHWTFEDNPFIPNRETVIEDVCKEFGVTADSPFVQREYFGRMGVYDLDAKVYKDVTTYDKLPQQPTWWRAYIGVDFGFSDDMAVISAVVDKLNKRMYVVKEWHKNKCTVSEVAEEVKKQYDALKDGEYGEIASNVYVITDTDQQTISYELMQTYHIPNVLKAYKYQKMAAIDALATMMRVGQVQIPNKGYLHQETELTLWTRDEETDKIVYEIDDETYHPDGLSALLYMSRFFAFEVLGTEVFTPQTILGDSVNS